MTIVLLIVAIVVTYALLIVFKQLQTLKERVERLEVEKRETEALLLSFMESMNDVVKQEVVVESTSREPDSLPVQRVEEDQPSDQQLVEETLLRHSVRDAARLLGKGEGEMALYAKFRSK